MKVERSHSGTPIWDKAAPAAPGRGVLLGERDLPDWDEVSEGGLSGGSTSPKQGAQAVPESSSPHQSAGEYV